VVIAAVPGMSPENLEITYTDNTLTLSGTVPSAVESEQGQNATWYLHELWSGQFQRTVTLPFEVDPAQAQATFEHGIVRITLPKAEWAKPQKIAIKAGSGQPAPAAKTEPLRAGATNGGRPGEIPGRSSSHPCKVGSP
jgi:HSP20 family protein